MVRRVRRSVAAVVAAAALCAPLAATAAGENGACPPPRLKVWLVRRQGSAPRPLVMNLVVLGDSHADPAVVFVVSTQRVHGRRVVLEDGTFSAFMIDGTDEAWVKTYGDGRFVAPLDGTTPGPPAAALCQVSTRQANPDGERMVDQQQPTDLDFYVAASGMDVAIKVKSPGWTVTPLKGGAVHTVSGAASGTGAESQGVRVEHFDGTGDVPGGRWGSVALGMLPCWPALALGPAGYVASGVGAGWLHGGEPVSWVSEREADCHGWGIAVGGASGPTTWRFSGEAFGESLTSLRLGVFDLPKP
ncbi:MAG: hypothetical protein QOE45_692 [Frankiaceae bacterium]|jgi:hypothetical protein|nr:hypothetical protein [Frankiaceae bacterium]